MDGFKGLSGEESKVSETITYGAIANISYLVELILAQARI